MRKGFQGPRRAGRPLLLEGGLDWKPLSLSPKDMDFISARNGATRFLAERDFLDWLIGHPRPRNVPPYPLPETNRAHNTLTLEQLRMYAEFRESPEPNTPT